jgi:hypothetical protein
MLNRLIGCSKLCCKASRSSLWAVREEREDFEVQWITCRVSTAGPFVDLKYVRKLHV